MERQVILKDLSKYDFTRMYRSCSRYV